MNQEKDLLKNLSKLEMIELDACTRCSECLNWCGIQDATDDPSISPPEKIKTYRDFVRRTHGLRARLLGGKEITEDEWKKFQDAIYTCTGCGACGEVCPVGIHTQRLWGSLRRKMVDMGYKPPGGLPNLLKNAKEYKSIFPHSLGLRYKIWMPEGIKISESAELGYFEGCDVAWDAPGMASGAVKLFHAGGQEFTMLDPAEAWCCGWPLTVTGQWEIMDDLVNHNVEAYASRGVERLACSCPCCLQEFRDVWPKVYGGKLPFEVIHVTEVVADLIDEGRIEFTKEADERVTYHDPCQLTRGLVGPVVSNAPRKLIKSIPGVEYVELPRKGGLTRCCGAGGGIRGHKPEVAMTMGEMFIKEAEETGADTLLMSCPACYAMYVYKRLGKLHEWKDYQPKMKMDDIMQYASRFL